MARGERKSEIGFGFDPAESGHHFVLILPGDDESDTVRIEERFNHGEVAEPREPEPRACIDRYVWERIREPVQAHFNRRLKDAGRRSSRFELGDNYLAPYLGKEMTLLFWALDDIDPTDLPNTLANWQGLVPEERWWLYTTVKASGAGPEEGRDRGWRKAIRIAFADSPAPPPADGGRGLLPQRRPPPGPGEEPPADGMPTTPHTIRGRRTRRRAQPEMPSLFD